MLKQWLAKITKKLDNSFENYNELPDGVYTKL